MEFRLLRANEIECRIAMVKSWGISILLYKDARCDQNILDETVGALNWQRHHSRDNANCTVSIWAPEKKQWVEKEDTGTESYSEREKGLASDSFKRACFNWGIGRELYTAPAMFVKPGHLKKFTKTDDGRYTCKDRFRVVGIEYDGRSIAKVDVLNETSGEVLTFGEPVAEARKTDEVKSRRIGEVKAAALEGMLKEAGADLAKFMEHFKVGSFADLTEEQHLWLVGEIQKKNGNNRQGKGSKQGLEDGQAGDQL